LNPVLRLSDLTKTYRSGILGSRNVSAIQGISLEIQAGEILAVLGLNGSGKTTLTRCILDLVRPTSGSSWLLGISSSGSGWRGRVGYLPERSAIPPGIDPTEFLRLVAGVKGCRREEEEITLWLDRLALAGPKQNVLSKGMGRRFYLAAALLGQPELIFLDEPSDGLDPAGRREVRLLLLEAKERGASIVLNSHLLSEVEHLADRVAILKRGELVVEGRLSELTLTEDGHRIVVRGNGRGEHGYGVTTTCVSISGVETDRVVEKLQREGFTVAEVLPRRLSLEEVFDRYAL
jgi:ABC-2 type transport system ATP-binding protein